METLPLTYSSIEFNYSYDKHDPSGMGCVHEIITRDEYKLYNYKDLENETLLDIGGNNGLVSVILALLNPKSRIICLEPLKKQYEIIKKNIADNNLHNVVVYNKALHSTNGTIDIYIANSCSGASTTSVRDVEEYKKLEGGVVTENVDTITFDSLLRENNIQSVYYMKIDCEGGEYNLHDSEEFKKKIVKNLGGEFHQTSYGGNHSSEADELIKYCEKYIEGEISLTILDRYENVCNERKYYRK